MQIDKTTKYQALLVMVLGFSIIAIFFKLKYLGYVAIGVGTISLVFPTIGDLIVKAWFKLAHVLGWVNSRILLSIVFFCILFPISLLSRLFSKDNLMLKDEQDSTFKVRNHKFTKKDLENIW